MDNQTKDLIDLLAPFIKKMPMESKKRDRLYLALHSNSGCFVTHSEFTKRFKMYGDWMHYKIYFALNWPESVIRDFADFVDPIVREKLIHEASCLNKYRSAGLSKDKVDEALKYYHSLDIISSGVKYKRFMSGNVYRPYKIVYTPPMISEFYDRLFECDKDFYRVEFNQLFELEQIDYKDYLLSPYWYVVRYTVLYRDNNTCRICGCAAETVHHHNYSKEVLYGMDLDGLVSLCNSCHERIEFDGEEKIRCLDMKYKRFKLLMNGETI